MISTTVSTVSDATLAAQRASRALASAPTAAKDAALDVIARLLLERTPGILEANALDLADDHAAGLSEALLDRLSLTAERIAAMADGVREIIALPDPVGEEIEHRELHSGIDLRKVRVPLGVVAVVYEARPNVTIDCAALTIKSGNAIVLRGSSYAQHSNGVLAAIVREGLAEAGLPEDAAVIIGGGNREELQQLATEEDTIDLLIPRGGEGLKKSLKNVATVPVMYAAAGNCHVYVHSDADLEMARAIAYNAKVHRPGVCNSAETLLVDEQVAPAFLPGILADLHEAGVELFGDPEVIGNAGETPVGEALPEHWDTEFLDLRMVVGVVPDLDAAIDHVNRHGTGHSEAIVTGSEQAADHFVAAVDAAAVYVNASTRFTDGFEYGMGAEIGNSTQKLHARGPIGLRELTTFKYIGRGSGQVRG